MDAYIEILCQYQNKIEESMINDQLTKEKENAMKNVEIKNEKNVMTIKVDMSKTFGASKSGKTTIIASTEGNTQIQPGIFVGLNVYKK